MKPLSIPTGEAGLSKALRVPRVCCYDGGRLASRHLGFVIFTREGPTDVLNDTRITVTEPSARLATRAEEITILVGASAFLLSTR
jgi:hypothetical protein